MDSIIFDVDYLTCSGSLGKITAKFCRIIPRRIPMKKLYWFAVLSAFAFLAIAMATGLSGCSSGSSSGDDAGVKPRVTIIPDKDSAIADGKEKITITFRVRYGSTAVPAGGIVNVTTDNGVFEDGTKQTQVYTDDTGQAVATITSNTVGDANIQATYLDSNVAKTVVTFKSNVVTGPCTINMSIQGGGPAQVEADGVSTINIVAKAVGADNKAIPVGTVVTFTTTDGSFDPNNPDMKKADVFVNSNDGSAVATLVSSNVKKTVKVSSAFLCTTSDAGAGIAASSFIMVDFIEPTAKPRIDISADTYFVLANGNDKAIILAVLKKADGSTPTYQEVPNVSFTATYGTFENGKSNIVNDNVDGKATAIYSPGNMPGVPVITAMATIEGKPTSAKLSIKAIKSGTLTCDSVSNKSIGLKGSGHIDNSTIVFKALDNDTNPITNLPIAYTISKSPGGVYITPTSTKTDNNGNAQTLLYAGTVPTTVTVTATSKVGSASCPPIVLTTGVPNSRFLNFSCLENSINVGGMALDLIEQYCTVAIADRFSNKIPFATKLFFMTEAGAVTPSAETNEGTEPGMATVTLRTQDPRPQNVPPFSDEPRTGSAPLYNNPRDGLVTLIVATTGEEEFQDLNGNGQYDPGEPFVDMGEPFVDMNDNNMWDPGEQYIDVNGNGKYDGPNGVWDGNTLIWKPTWVVWTGGLAGGGSCSNIANSYSMICPKTFDIPNGGSMDFILSLKDYNLLPINPTGSVEIKVDGPGKFMGKTSYQLLASRGIGIQGVRTQDSLDPNIYYETWKFGPYSSGFNAGFMLADDNVEDTTPKPVYITATTTYGYDPVKSTGGKIYADLFSSGIMNSSQSTGSCGLDVTYMPTLPVPADGISTVTISATARSNSGQPMPDNTNVTFQTDLGLFTGSGSRLIVVPTTGGTAQAVLTNYEAGGPANVNLSFTCDNGRKVVGLQTILFMPIVLSLETENGKTTLNADGTDFVKLTTFVTDSSKQPVADGAVIRYTTTAGKFRRSTSGCINTTVDGPICDVKTLGGYATADLVGGYIVGEADVQATLYGSNPPNSAGTKIKIIQIGKIEYVGIQRQPLGTKDSGYQETTFITFRVLDNSGTLLSGQQITFTVNGPQGDKSAAAIDTATGVSGPDGIVYKDPATKTLPTLSSGTLAGSVTVTARGVMGSQVVTTTSDAISVVGAKTNRKLLGFACSPKNLGGFGSSKLEATCHVTAADRYGNTVTVTQPVWFQAEAGSIQSVANISGGVLDAKLNTDHTKMPADVAPLPNEPSYTTVDGKVHNPRDGLVTVMVAIKGEEEFDDLNGNGKWDAGEPFVDQGEPFVDENDNDTYDNGEYYIDVNGNGHWDGQNGRWDSDSIVWRSTRILWSDLMVKGGDCLKTVPPHLSILCPPNATLADGGNQRVTYEIKDGNLNRLTSATNVVISAPSDVTLIGSLNFKLDDLYGMDINFGRARELAGPCTTCSPPPGACDCYIESTAVANFSSGYQGFFDVTDANFGDSGSIKKVNVTVDVKYDFDPAAGSPSLADNLIGQYTLNDPNAAGPCSFLLSAPQTAVADGVSSVTVSVSNITDQANAAVVDGTPISLSTDKGQFVNGKTTMTVLTAKDADGKANASAMLMVGNVPGNASITASFTCNGKTINRYAQIVLLDPAQTGKPTISVVSALPKVVTDGISTVAINAFVYQASGQPVTDGTTVTFVTTRSTLSAASATTVGGKATVYLNAGTVPGIATITATYQPPLPGTAIQGNTTVQLVSLGSIQFVSVDPAVLGVRNSGYNESATIVFKVLDNLGQPFQGGQLVKMSLSNAPGGAYLLITDAFTDDAGIVSTVLVTGTVATTLTVTAKATLSTTTLTGVTPAIPVIGAKPSAKYLSIGQPVNSGGQTTKVANFDEGNGQEYKFNVYLGDRYSNNVSKETTVHLRSEAGTITPETLSADAIALGNLRKIAPFPKDVPPLCNDAMKCADPSTHPVYSEPWYRIVGNPFYDPKHLYNPRDGLVTVIAVTTGEEEFDDDDGNGDFTPSDAFRVTVDPAKQGDAKCAGMLNVNADTCKWTQFNSSTFACSGTWNAYDPLTFHYSEPFVDLSEPFVDMNDNGVWDQGEPFFDTNQNGKWDEGNGIWDSNTNIWTEGFQTWVRSNSNPEWNKSGACNGASFDDDMQNGIWSRNWVCDDQSFTLPKNNTISFTGRLCDVNLNSLFSEAVGGLFGQWSTIPGVEVTDIQGQTQLVPVNKVQPEKFHLDSKESVLVKYAKALVDPKGYKEVYIGSDASFDYCYANTVFKKTKTVTVQNGCAESSASLSDVATTQVSGNVNTYMKLDITDSGGNVIQNVMQVNGISQH
jgi:hypothetical protein